MKTKSKKSISTLKKQKVDGKKVKGGNIAAGHAYDALEVGEGLHAGSAHGASAAESHVLTPGRFTRKPGISSPSSKTIPWN